MLLKASPMLNTKSITPSDFIYSTDRRKRDALTCVHISLRMCNVWKDLRDFAMRSTGNKWQRMSQTMKIQINNSKIEKSMAQKTYTRWYKCVWPVAWTRFDMSFKTLFFCCCCQIFTSNFIRLRTEKINRVLSVTRNCIPRTIRTMSFLCPCKTSETAKLLVNFPLFEADEWNGERMKKRQSRQ